MDISVELKGVTKRFGDVTAADNVNLEIGRGEFFSLLGPSGCGKTTTLRLVAGFEQPTEGEILINNVNVSNKRPYERNVNTVFQSYALFPHLTVAGNIRFGLERKKTPKDQMSKLVDEALDLVAERLKEIKDRSGSDSIGILCSARITNEENYLAQKFTRAVIGTNNVDHCARL